VTRIVGRKLLCRIKASVLRTSIRNARVPNARSSAVFPGKNACLRLC
jgi:hypothetical protein